ncbi:23056_t:CDS:2 [Entrophospora sp. SA101]|nr:23056_t:CDS:2 [Entrophospora sp. SA101]
MAKTLIQETKSTIEKLLKIYEETLTTEIKILESTKILEDNKKKPGIKEEITTLNDELSKLLRAKDEKEVEEKAEETQAVDINIDDSDSNTKTWDKKIKRKIRMFSKIITIHKSPTSLKSFDSDEIEYDELTDVHPPITRGSKDHVKQKMYLGIRNIAEKLISSSKPSHNGPEFIKLKEEIVFLKKLSKCYHILDVPAGFFLISQWGDYNLRTILTEEPERLNWSEKSASDPIDDERWSAPERLNGEEYTKASEIYSFAIILWEIATNKLPYKNISNEELKTKIINGEKPTPKSVPGTPKNYQQVIERGWCDRPNDRSTIEEMVVILDKLSFDYIAGKKVDTIGDDKVGLLSLMDNSDARSINDASSILELDNEYYTPVDLPDTDDQQHKQMLIKLEQLNPFNKKNHDIQKAIQLHEEKSYKKAWKIFSDLEKKNSTPESKFWVGFYYYKGYYEGANGKANSKEAMKYLSEAAKLDHVDAQYWYATVILNNGLASKEHDNVRYKVALDYLRQASKLEHPLALRKLGRIIQKGEYGVKLDRSIGKGMVERSKSFSGNINNNKENERPQINRTSTIIF